MGGHSGRCSPLPTLPCRTGLCDTEATGVYQKPYEDNDNRTHECRCRDLQKRFGMDAIAIIEVLEMWQQEGEAFVAWKNAPPPPLSPQQQPVRPASISHDTLPAAAAAAATAGAAAAAVTARYSSPPTSPSVSPAAAATPGATCRNAVGICWVP